MESRVSKTDVWPESEGALGGKESNRTSSFVAQIPG